VTFAAAWAFAGLALLVPLVLLHLRQRGEVVRRVPSLLLWEELELADTSRSRGLRRPSRPLLLLLQALALALIVTALAKPESLGSVPKPVQAIVLDDSWRMQAPGRVAEARGDVERILAADPRGTSIRIVLASGSPAVIYRGGAAEARAALARVRASAAPAELGTALTIAAGLLAGPRDSVVLIRAPEDPVPAVSATAGELRTVTLAAAAGDQGIFAAGARCGIGATQACEVYATVRNTSEHSVDDLVSADAAGHPSLSLHVRVAPDSSAPLALESEPGQQVSLRLRGGDPLPADDAAWVTVPAADDLPASSVVTIVGAPAVALASAQAFAAVPGVVLRLRTRATFRDSDAAQSGLVVLDHWIPPGGLPPSPAVLLVDPPRLPGGHVGGALGETVVSGTDAGSGLLDGVDLSSLSIDSRAASQLTLPGWLAPVVWSPDGVLLAAGDSGRQRVATLSFEPGQSDLPQLPALPILAANLVRWAAGWAPTTTSAGVPFAIDATSRVRALTLERGGAAAERVDVAHAPVALTVRTPGLYTVRETGPGIARDAIVAVNTAEAPSADPQRVDLNDARIGEGRGAPANRAPWFLLAALIVLGLEWAYWRSTRRRSAQSPRASGRARLWSTLPALAPLLLVLALLDPQLHSGSHRTTVLAVDESASIDPASRTLEQRWTARADRDGCISPCRVLRFATTPAATTASRTRTSGLGTGATDLQSAIGAAVGLAPDGGRVAVLSDGGQTQGDLLATAALARERNVEVDWVAVGDGGQRDATITAISVPPVVHLGDTVPLTLTVHSSVAALAVLSVRTGAAPAASQTIALRAGDNPLLLLYTAAARGWQSFQASISLPGDGVSANNSLAAVTDVVAAPRVLSVGGAHSAVPGLLARDGLSVTQLEPAALPSSAAGYAGADAVVLDDVSASQLGATRIAALSDAVRGDSLGLVVLGGAHSFSLGGYAQSTLQQLLPVSSLVPGNLQRRNLAIELVLDHSGSMIEPAGGVQKIAMARAAAVQSAAFLHAHQDALGIVDFDIKPHTLVPLQLLTSAADERQVDHIVAGLQADGGTNIYLGLKAGLTELLKSSAKQRHIILMTDGISQPANYAPLLAQLRSDHISVATVALGADADRSLLAEIAVGTGGRAYVTEKASELPRIFVKETQLSAKPVRVTGRLSAQLASDSPVVRSLIGKRLPGLRGNVVVQLKSGAQADLLAGDTGSQRDPALAEWQVGTGRVVAWTPGLDSDWAGGWLGETSLWNDAVRWTERGVAASPLTPVALGGASGSLRIDLASAGTAALGVSAIDGTLTDSSGVARPIRFAPVGPSLYQADVASWPEGVYRFALQTRGAVRQSATGELALGYPAEYSPVSARVSPMAQLVAQAGGRVFAGSQLGALASGERPLWWILALAALVAFLLGVAGRMLSSGSSSRPSRAPAIRSSSGSIVTSART
jgi:hypothetical protein